MINAPVQPYSVAAEMVRAVPDTPSRIPLARNMARPLAAAAEGQAVLPATRHAYFEIFYAEAVSVTSILFSGGDWRWRFCSEAGATIAEGEGYSSQRACAAAVAALCSGAGKATIRAPSPYPAGWLPLARICAGMYYQMLLQSGSERWPVGSNARKERPMAKSQRKSNKEVRKPKKTEPPKQNAANPSLKGTPTPDPAKRV
jgi:uncharacterized protein YegP (UPF0339 family)